MNQKKLQRDSETAQTYEGVYRTFILGYLRFNHAALASQRLSLALVVLHAPESGDEPAQPAETPPTKIMSAIKWESFDSLEYVMRISLLVYVTALLDTFLTETTTFLFLLIPESMGKSQQVPLKTLIDAESRNAALTQAAVSRAREVSYKTFSDRLQFLRDAFGLDFDLDGEAEELLNHYSDLRNSAVHDQGILEFRLDDSGKVSSRQRTCERHPTKLTDDDPFDAGHAYAHICNEVARSVFLQVLKRAPEQLPKLLSKAQRGGGGRTFPWVKHETSPPEPDAGATGLSSGSPPSP
jgi:hypothetical protein